MTMNDRFAAQLRQHLVDSANERPAEGQLAALVDAVATTAQKPSVLARWTWFPGRVGSVPTAALRLGFVAVALAAALVAGMLIAGGPTGRSTVFEGTWTAVDPGDGSLETLVVGAGGSPRVRFVDERSTGGACVADEVKVFTAAGDGTIVDDRLVVLWPNGGGCGSGTIEMGPGEYRYRQANDVLVDGDGLVWTRASEPQVMPSGEATSAPASAEPALSPSATSAPAPTAEGTLAPSEAAGCIPNGGQTFDISAGELTVTATVPADAGYEWQGDPRVFSLDSQCEAGAIGINVVPFDVASANTCTGSPLAVAAFADAVAALAMQHESGVTGPVDLTIGGYAAARFDAADLIGCTGGFGLIGGAIIGEFEHGSIYVIDVDGSILTVELNVADGTPAAQVDEAREIVETFAIAKSKASTSG